MRGITALSIGAALFLTLNYFHIAEKAWRIAMLLAGAVFVGYLIRGQTCRVLRRQYPNARWIGLLAVGLSIMTFGCIARWLVPGGHESMFTMAFILPAGVCIFAFVIINRKDPDVTR